MKSGFQTRIIQTVVVMLLLSTSGVHADITYTLMVNSNWTDSIKSRIKASMDEALTYYNKYGSFNHHINVQYNPAVPTAEASFGSYLAFGKSISGRVAMHEIAHTLGSGTYWHYNDGYNNTNSIWTGPLASALIQTFDGPGAVLKGDYQHFWPYGLNYDSEGSATNRIRHVRIMAALRCDNGFLGFFQEPQSQVAQEGETVTFTVQAYNANRVQWYKDGQAISGASSQTLQLARVHASDAGVYTCVAKSSTDTLISRPARLSMTGMIGTWNFDGNMLDRSGASHDAIATGSPSYVSGRINSAIHFNGSTDALTLPAGVADANDLTIACWVKWDGDSQWQRIFDFGNNEAQYMFLTPRSGNNTLHFAIKNCGDEQQLNAPQLTSGQWTHVAVTLNGDKGKLYVNGIIQDSSASITLNPIAFAPTVNYIGKSQFSADPLFKGSIDELAIFNYVLSATDIQNLAAGNPVSPPPNYMPTDVPLQTGLTWSKSAKNPSWQVYLGTSGSDVANATPLSQEYLGVRHEAQLITPILKPDTVYDWRVDTRYEDGSIEIGAVRSFKTGSDLTNVLPKFDAPVIILPDAQAGSPYDESLQDHVLFPDMTALGKLTGPAWIKVSEDGQVTGTPPAGAAGPLTLSVQAYDTAGHVDEAVIQLEVQDTHQGTYDLDPNLVACWSMDNAWGNTIHDSVGQHPGTLHHMDESWRPLVALPQGQTYGLAFAGNKSWASINGFTGVLGPTSRTCCAWIKTQTANRVILSWGADQTGGQWLVKLDQAGKLSIDVNGGQITGSTSLIDGVWHHVTAVLPDKENPASNDILLFVDGNPETINAVSNASVHTIAGGDVRLGVSDSNSGYFQGLMDEVRIYNRALSTTEIATLAARDLQLHLSFDEVTGLTAVDQSRYNRVSQLSGAPQWHPTQGMIGGALELDGVGDGVQVTGYPGILGRTARTCCAWIKTNHTNGSIVSWGQDQGNIRGSNGYWDVRVNDAGQLEIKIGQGRITGSTQITDDNWHHIAVVLPDNGNPDISDASLYVDGQLETNSDVFTTPVNTVEDNDVNVGVFPPQADYFKGLIDDLRIYDTALEPDQIQTLME